MKIRRERFVKEEPKNNKVNPLVLQSTRVLMTPMHTSVFLHNDVSMTS